MTLKRLATPGVTALALGNLGSYVALTKPHVTVMMLGITLAAMAVASAIGGMPSLSVALATLVGGAMAAGSANAINCYCDRDVDAVMTRMRRRPLPSCQMDARYALIFGIRLGVASLPVLAFGANLLNALLALAAIFF